MTTNAKATKAYDETYERTGSYFLATMAFLFVLFTVKTSDTE